MDNTVILQIICWHHSIWPTKSKKKLSSPRYTGRKWITQQHAMLHSYNITMP